MKSKTLKQMTDAQAIRIAELALAESLAKYCVIVKRKKEEVDVIYVLYARQVPPIFKKNSPFSALKEYFHWVEIDSAFNINESTNAMCNMDVIYDLLKFWGFYNPKYDKTGIWHGKGVKIPKTIEEVANFKS